MKIGVLIGAAATSLLAVGLSPAVASTGPSITVNTGAVNIAVQGPNNSLKFYWAVNGSKTWHAQTVAGKGAVR